MKEMTRQGLSLHPHSEIESVTRDADSTLTIRLKRDGGVFHGFDQVLVATGRVPNTQGLGLESIGVMLSGPKGHIHVDDYQNMNHPGLYALGDVCGRVELTPMAIAAGRRLADRLFGGEAFRGAKADYTNVPTVIFTHPPIGTVGLTEAEAAATYGKDGIKTYNTAFTPLYYGPWDVPPTAKPRTQMRVVCEKQDPERLLGIHVIGPGADELIQGFGVVVKMGGGKGDLDACVAIHPTSAEELVTLAPWGRVPSRSRL